MHHTMYPTKRALHSRELLFVGFGADFDANILHFPYQDEDYHYDILENTDQAFAWLESRISTQNPFRSPYALICKLHWLRANQFNLTRRLMAHPELRYVPIIALSEPTETADKTDLAQWGIDDCYSIPIEWKILNERLLFLDQYKPKLINLVLKSGQIQGFQFKTPLDKRIFDIIGATLGIILSIPLWVLIAAAIRIESKGPVIYISKRIGAGYKMFNFFKFRSMFFDADQQLDEYGHLNQYKSTQGAPVFVKLVNDPRVTKVGRFIRRYSLDELPQLINVLRGDMSLVGNRPLPVYEAEMLVKDEWCERFLAPAGLTGLWQVSKRGQDDMLIEERIKLDIDYSRNYSIWQDLSIIARTFRAVVQHANV
jgi:lipopolysaccharide/colanic/teichoic acid biosynthesis glycosyltransferase